MVEGEKVLLLPAPKIDPSLSRGQSQPSSTTPRVPPFHSLLQSPILLRLDIYSNISLGQEDEEECRRVARWESSQSQKSPPISHACTFHAPSSSSSSSSSLRLPFAAFAVHSSDNNLFFLLYSSLD